MRRFYQESWQGIPFTAIAHVSFWRLADSRFYSVFYEELFRRYKSWDDLPKIWRENKARDAQWLAEQFSQIKRENPDQPLRVLSIGSGVGYMEKCLLELRPDIDLHVNEPGTVGMKWLRAIIPASRVYIGMPTHCVPSDITFDAIYLSAVDYGIPARDFLRLLEFLRERLTPRGELFCVSASLLQEDSPIGALVNGLKIIIRGFLHYLGIRRQQFWGWRRSQKEYRKFFTKAGFQSIADGFLDDGFDSYWIRGSK